MRNTRSILVAGIQLPVNPQEIAVNVSQLMQTKELVSGEYVEMGEKGLMRCTLNTFIPNENSVFYGGIPQQTILSTLISRKDGGNPVQLVIPGVCNDSFFITSLTQSVREGEEDIHLTLELVQQKMLKTSAGSFGSYSTTGRSTEPSTGGNYTVVKGDNLHKIAKLQLGDSSRWREIYQLNKGQIKDPNLIYPGQVFVLP